MFDFGLCVIITEPCIPVEDIVKICVDQEIRYLQLREKGFTDLELLVIADKIQELTEGTSTKFIMNDRLDIGLLAQSDGIHLGQTDLPLERMKRLLPDYMFKGLSTHSLHQLGIALSKNPDYVGFGPVYKTPTKKTPDPVVGLKLLAEAMDISTVPVIAIGGIDFSNIHCVLKAGARNISMVRALMRSNNVDKSIREARGIIEAYWNRQGTPLEYL